MDTKKFILRSEAIKDNAIEYLAHMFIDASEPMEVTIKPYKRNRSTEQNATYWMWVSTIGNDLGYSKEDMHEVLMRKFLTPHVMEIEGETIEVYSTRRLKVKGMTEYLEHVSRFAAEMGIILRYPEDIQRNG